MMDSIIFDLDGTLWDSREEVCIAWNQVLANYPVERKIVTVDDMTRTMGMILDDIGKVLFPELEDSVREKLIDECCHRENQYLEKHGAKVFEGVIDGIKELSKKYKLFIVSNCNAGYIETFVNYYKLNEYITDLECPGNSGLKKADNNKLIIERNNLKSPVYVGDTQGDSNSAKEAGIPFILCNYGYGKNVTGYIRSIDSFSELLNL